MNKAPKVELLDLLSVVEIECLSSSLSRGSLIPERGEQANCSIETYLTSSLETGGQGLKAM